MAEQECYEIRVQGRLGPEWSGWLGDMAISLAPNGETVLNGPVSDQAALYGILIKIRDLGIPLLSVQPVSAGRQARIEKGGL
jgi:hypothetical protein